jgi:hypothetical protein
MESDNENAQLIEEARRQFNARVKSGRPRFVLRTKRGTEITLFFDEIFWDVERGESPGCEGLPLSTSLTAKRELTKAEWREVDAWQVEIVSEWSQRTGQRMHFLSAAGDKIFYVDGEKIRSEPARKASQTTVEMK